MFVLWQEYLPVSVFGPRPQLLERPGAKTIMSRDALFFTGETVSMGAPALRRRASVSCISPSIIYAMDDCEKNDCEDFWFVEELR